MPPNDRFRPFAAVYLVLLHNDKILLLRRFNTGYQDGNYSLVAGHLDGKETTKQCVIREAKEEAGIAIKEEDLEVVHVMHRQTSEREYFDIYLSAKKWTGEVSNQEPDKCDDLSWFELDALPPNILSSVKFALENISNKTHFSEFGWS